MAKKFICTSTEPVVDTKYGKLRGFQLGEIYHFYGIKYANAKRFKMPVEVEPWDGIRDALSYGYVAPLMEKEEPEGDLLMPHRCWPQDENCQYLNIWTPSIEKDAKKPVMIWIHGGVYSAGSSIRQIAYDGKNLSEFGDVVVVSLNHRLNIIGYLDLSAFGEKYWNTANLGQADIVAALQWIQDNIKFFGGDPDNVTVFGQSGGGGKINALLQTPAADKLFHKAIIQSGLWSEEGFPHMDASVTKLLVEGMLKVLELDSVDALETVAYEKLVEAFDIVAPKLKAEGYSTNLGPTQNDWYKGNALNVGFTEGALKRSVLAGTILAEFNPFTMKEKDSLSEEERYAIVKAKYGDNVDEIINLFKKAYPEKNIVDVIALDTFFREPAIAWLDAKAAAGGEKNYSFMFAPDFTLNGGKPAWHGSEIPFVFHNVDKVPMANIPCADLLEAQVAGAWVNFARYGNPNNESLPQWEPYCTGSEITMVFSEKSEARSRLDKDLVALVKK